MLVKWVLSGEWVEYPSTPHTSIESAIRDSFPSNRHDILHLQTEDILPHDREMGVAAYAWWEPLLIHVPKLSTESSAAVHYDWFDWLSTCVNVDLLTHYHQKVRLSWETNAPLPDGFAHWAANPHPMVVEMLLHYLHSMIDDEERTDRHEWLFAIAGNPADEIVDWLLAHPQRNVFSHLVARNPNPKLIPFFLERLPKLDQPHFARSHRYFAQSPHREVLQWIWKNRDKQIDWLRGNHSDAAAEIFLEWLDQPSPPNENKILLTHHPDVVDKWLDVMKKGNPQTMIRCVWHYHITHTPFVEWVISILDQHPRLEWVLDELCQNEHPLMVEWLHQHGRFRFPALLANAHPLAVQVSQTWLQTQERMTPEMIYYLKKNHSFDMARWIAKQYADTAIWQTTLIGMLGRFEHVRVVWET